MHTLDLKPLWAGSGPIASWRQRCFKCIQRERKYKPHLCWFLIKKKSQASLVLRKTQNWLMFKAIVWK